MSNETLSNRAGFVSMLSIVAPAMRAISFAALMIAPGVVHAAEVYCPDVSIENASLIFTKASMVIYGKIARIESPIIFDFDRRRVLSRNEVAAGGIALVPMRVNITTILTTRQKMKANVIKIVHAELCEGCSPSTYNRAVSQFDTKSEYLFSLVKPGWELVFGARDARLGKRRVEFRQAESPAYIAFECGINFADSKVKSEVYAILHNSRR